MVKIFWWTEVFKIKTQETVLNSGLTYCKICQKIETIIFFANNQGVFLRKTCSQGEQKDIKIAKDYDWYMNRVSQGQVARQPKFIRPAEKGCPLDCGLCSNHANDINLPVFSITNDCNLNCPICFTFNRPDKKYFKSLAEVENILQRLLAQKNELEVINITGGEPTLHPNLFEIIKLFQRKEIRRITINTNGIKIAKDPDFAKRIKEANVQMVLSLNTFDPQKSQIIHGKDISGLKKRALAVFEELDIPITILSVAIKNLNESDLSQIVPEYILKKFVKSITIQNMTFTGENGSQFYPREHITLDEIENVLCLNENFSAADFFPLGSAHPLCYSVAYYLIQSDKLFPLTKLISREKLIEHCSDSYLLATGSNLQKDFWDGINNLWASGADEELIPVLRDFLKRLYPKDRDISPPEREKIAEAGIKAVYIHSHMDEDNFDIDRVSRCGDVVPDESGALIPACSYNLWYRENDERFWKKKS